MKKIWRVIQTIRIYSQDIGVKFSIDRYAMLKRKTKKRETAEGIELQNQGCIRTLVETENHKYLGILEADPIKQADMKKSITVPQKKEKVSGNYTRLQKSHQRDKYLGSSPCKLLGIILKIEKIGSYTDGPQDKEIGDYAQVDTSKKMT